MTMTIYIKKNSQTCLLYNTHKKKNVHKANYYTQIFIDIYTEFPYHINEFKS